MEYKLTTPCAECPFLLGSRFAFSRLMQHASGEFACHKTCRVDDETGHFVATRKSSHCAGALIFLEKQGMPHQMMRICERLGRYDRSRLNMDAPVGSKPLDYRGRNADI